VNSGGVGAHGQLARSSNGLSPETNTNAQRILFMSIALTFVPLDTKLLELPAQFLIGSPGTLPVALQSWMTIKKTEISAQHEFLKQVKLCVHRGIVLIYLDVHQKC